MRGTKPSVLLAALGVVGLAVWAAAYVDQTGSQMATAAERFLGALDKDQAAKATYPFDAPERLDSARCSAGHGRRGHTETRRLGDQAGGVQAGPGQGYEASRPTRGQARR